MSQIRRNSPLLVGLMGVTNTGKSTFMSSLRDSGDPSIGFIEVGKELRRRHPPEYFDGLGAMKKTEKEVWEIFDEQFGAAVDSDARVVICDGMPRMENQVQELIDRTGDFRILLLHAPREVLVRRAENRDSGYPGSLALSMQRLDNDYKQLWDVLMRYKIVTRNEILLVDTTQDDWIWQTVILLEETWKQARRGE